MKLKAGERGALIFTLVYLVIFTIYYIYNKNYEFLIYIAVIIILGVIVLKTLRKSGITLGGVWLLTSWGLLHLMGGSVRVGDVNLYRYQIIHLFQGEGQFFLLRMDQVIHFYGFFVAAIIIYQLLAPRIRNINNSKMAIFIAWIAAMGLGALNEVIEFTLLVSLTKTGVGDLYNMGLDLVFNFFGALAGAFFASYLIKRKTKS